MQSLIIIQDPTSFASVKSQLQQALRNGVNIDEAVVQEVFNMAMATSYEKLVMHRMAKQREEKSKKIKKLAGIELLRLK